MKTLKLVLIAAFIAAATVSNSQDRGFSTPPVMKVINVTLQQAIQSPGLVLAMYQQLDPGFLNNNQPVYTQAVIYNNYIVRITGTYEEWAWFFSHRSQDR